MTVFPHITRLGLPGIDQVPIGIHACHFYSTRDQLVAALVPYALAGLRAHERCLFIAAPPLPAREALEALRATSGDIDDAVQTGALRIVDFDQWYENSAGSKGLDVVELWLKEEERALADGYTGLRITGNTSFLKPGDWPVFIEYEEALTARLAGRRIVTLCSYARSQCDDEAMKNVMYAHHCAIHRPDARWQVLPVRSFPG